MEAHEEGLDPEGPDASGLPDVFEDSGEGDAGAVDGAVVGVGAGVELGPDAELVSVEVGEGVDDGGACEEGGVGDEDDGGVSDAGTSEALDDDFGGIGELEAGGGFAVAGEGDVGESAEGGGGEVEGGVGVKFVGEGELEEVVEFGAEGAQVEFGWGGGVGAVDAAVDAVEVAGFVGVEVDADAEAPGSARDDGVDEAGVLPRSFVDRVQDGEGGHEGRVSSAGRGWDGIWCGGTAQVKRLAEALAVGLGAEDLVDAESAGAGEEEEGAEDEEVGGVESAGVEEAEVGLGHEGGDEHGESEEERCGSGHDAEDEQPAADDLGEGGAPREEGGHGEAEATDVADEARRRRELADTPDEGHGDPDPEACDEQGEVEGEGGGLDAAEDDLPEERHRGGRLAERGGEGTEQDCDISGYWAE